MADTGAIQDFIIITKSRVIFLNSKPSHKSRKSATRVSPFDSSQPLRLESAPSTRVSPFDSSQPLRLESAPSTRVSPFDSSQPLRLESAPSARVSPIDSSQQVCILRVKLYGNTYVFQMSNVVQIIEQLVYYIVIVAIATQNKCIHCKHPSRLFENTLPRHCEIVIPQRYSDTTIGIRIIIFCSQLKNINFSICFLVLL